MSMFDIIPVGAEKQVEEPIAFDFEKIVAGKTGEEILGSLRSVRRKLYTKLEAILKEDPVYQEKKKEWDAIMDEAAKESEEQGLNEAQNASLLIQARDLVWKKQGGMLFDSDGVINATVDAWEKYLEPENYHKLVIIGGDLDFTHREFYSAIGVLCREEKDLAMWQRSLNGAKSAIEKGEPDGQKRLERAQQKIEVYEKRVADARVRIDKYVKAHSVGREMMQTQGWWDSPEERDRIEAEFKAAGKI